MTTIHGKVIIHDAVDPFKGLCPVCGEKLELKRIHKRKNAYSRGVRSFVCKCGYAEYDSTEREQAILNGIFDDEL